MNKAADLGNLTQAIFDDATYPHPYFGTAIDLVGQPTSGQYRVIYIPYFSSVEGYSVQIAVGAVGNDGLHWRKAFGKTWMPWGPTLPQEYDLPLAAGYVVAYGQACSYSKAQDNLTVVHVSVARQDGANLNGILNIATLPQGFRPHKAVVVCPAFGVYLKADIDGSITCQTAGVANSLAGSLVFYAAAEGPQRQEKTCQWLSYNSGHKHRHCTNVCYWLHG